MKQPRVYQTVNQAVLDLVPRDARRVLDVGCGGGAFGGALKARNGAVNTFVAGLTFSEAEAALASDALDAVYVKDLNDLSAEDLGQAGYDCIVCSHVLEHVLAPEQVLMTLQSCLAPEGVVVVALPNVLFWRQRLQFLRGHFRYTEGGLMDRTHLRFFDWESAHALLTQAGLQTTRGAADGGLPGSRHLGPTLSRRLDRAALSRYPGLFGAQFVFSARASVGERAGS